MSGFESLRASQGDEMSTLEDFRGNVLLTDEEKEYRLRKLDATKLDGEIDEEMISFIDFINNLKSFVTTQCCWGHGEEDDRLPHIDIRTKFAFEVFYPEVYPWMDTYGVTLQIMGDEMGIPRYCFWLQQENWRDILKCLCRILRRLDEGRGAQEGRE